MLQRLRQTSPWARLAALGLILYASRALAEAGAQIAWPAGAVVGAALGLALSLIVIPFPGTRFGAHPLEKGGNARRIPALLLWAYVLYPAYDPAAALWVGLAALLALLIADAPDPPARWVDAGVFGAALALYWLTLAPGLLPADAGEFQLVAAKLGIAHPPGYPLYTLIGGLFAQLMPGDPARGVNLFSAVAAALAVMLAGRAAHRFGGSAWAGVAAAAVLAVAPSFWSTATQASIRPLMALFTALAVERLAKMTTPPGPFSQKERGSRQGALVGFALAFGLGVAHHPSLVFPGVFFAIYLLLVDPALIRAPRRWLAPVGAFALGFLPWLYLPIRGAMGAPLAPAGIDTWPGFWDHVLARGFAGDLYSFRTAVELADRALVWINILRLQWNPAILGAAVIAAILLAWRDWRAMILLGGGFALTSFVTMTYRAPQTVEYLIPAYVLLAVLIGAGIGKSPRINGRRINPPAKKIMSNKLDGSLIGGIMVAVVVTAAAAQAARQWSSFAWMARDDSTREAATAILDGAPPDAVVLASWHWAMPMQALQAIEETRPDVDVIYVFPEGAEPLAETWVRRIAGRHIDASIAQRPVIVTSFYPVEFGGTPYFFEPIDGGWLVRDSPRRDVPDDMSAANVTFNGAGADGQTASLTLAGIEMPDPGAARVGETFDVRLAWRVDAPPGEDVTAFVHFVNAEGTVIASSDRVLPTSRAQAGDVLVERYTLGMPPWGLASPADTYRLAIGLYVVRPNRLDHYSVNPRVPTWTTGKVTVLPAVWPAPTAHPARLFFANGARITGFDHEGESVLTHGIEAAGTPFTARTAADIAASQPPPAAGGSPRLGPWGIPLGRAIHIPAAVPGERYVPLGGQMVLSRAEVAPASALAPGDPARVDLSYLSTRPLLVDGVAKIDLIGADYAWREQSDHVPATGALPTLKWLWGWRVEDRHRLRVPADASPGSAHVELVVYDHFTNQVLPILDPVLSQQGIAVPLYVWP